VILIIRAKRKGYKVLMKGANNCKLLNVLSFENQNNHGKLCYMTHMNVRKLKSKIHSIQLSLNFLNNNW
jgi:hypothetical protein